VQPLAGWERFQRDAFQEEVLLEHASGEPQEVELGLIHEQHLASVARGAPGVSVPDEPAFGLGHGGIHRAHRLAARSGKTKCPHHACGHFLEASNGTTAVTSFE